MAIGLAVRPASAPSRPTAGQESSSHHRWLRWLELAIIVGVAAIATVPAMSTPPHVVYDSASYLQISLYRLPVVPVIYRALGENFRAIIVVQALAGAACWSCLAVEGLRSTRRPYCYVAAAGVLVVSCSDYVTHWYTAILSDSFSLSLMALLLASIASWLQRRGSLARVVVVALLWAGTRDTNGYLLLLVGVVGLLVVLCVRRRAGPIVASVVAIAAGIGVIWSAKVGGIWLQPFEHVLTERILVDPAKVGWFRARGMPATPALQHLAGPWLPASEQALTHSPALASFRTWLHSHAESAYATYAVLHPGWAVSGTFGPQQAFNQATLAYYSNPPHDGWLPGPVRQFLLSHTLGTLYVASGATATVLLLKFRALRNEARRLVGWGILAALGFIGLVIDWVGDSWEVGRHSIGSSVQIWVCLAFVAAIALGATRGGHGPREAAAGRPSGL